MDTTRTYLERLGVPGTELPNLSTSPLRFPDGGQYRVEIPSVEGPDALQAVIETAGDLEVPVHRVSQGSGIMLLTDAEIERMVALGADHGIEVCLFTGPRATWDVGVQAVTPSGRVLGASLRGLDQLVYGIEDVRRACRLGIRSVLVADLGQLWVLGRMQQEGELPPDLVLKVSVSLAPANPATARVLAELGATTINLPVDLSLAQIAAVRRAVEAPLDVYVEGPDDFGGPVRYYEVPELVRVAAPVYLKFTVRNAPNIYPSGGHLLSTAIATARERVRRAAIGLEILGRYYPQATPSPSGKERGSGALP
jgi:hypothetical protein